MAEGAADLESAHGGQHEVEQHEIRRGVSDLAQGFFAAARARDLVALALKVEEDEVADVPLVLDDEHTARHVAAILPAARLTELHDPGAIGRHPAARGLC